MVEFRWHKFANDGTPRISDKDIEAYAERILRDYKPGLLKEPGKINPVHFLESYLGITIEYTYIYHPDGPGRIAGEAIFNDDEEVEIFDEEKIRKVVRLYSANTVLIDNKTMDDGKEGFADFTHLHEGGHIFLHQSVFKRTHKQESFLDQQPRTQRCLRSCIGLEKKQLVTQEDFREHQANTFSAAMAMPPSVFIPTAREIIKECGYSEGICIVTDPEEVIDWFDLIDGRDYEVVYKLMDLFTGSRTAIRVQLKKHKLLMTEEEYMKRNPQRKLFI